MDRTGLLQSSDEVSITSTATMNINKQEDEEVYRLTAKGLLCVKLAPFGVTFNQVDEIWENLKSFVQDQAKQNNYEDGIPAIVLDGGGECIMVTAKRSEEFTEELKV